MVEVQGIESGIDKENRNVDDERTYPITPKLTQKTNCDNIPQYWIPDNYIIKTEGHAEWNVHSTKSVTVVINTFLKV
ncbi:9775_t:CDS:2 [Diversispora eburnea]|uniref:9775_t:CDS:1 n=1 Tax=Diversispora eburnea TaxID=1213867 RepID=A0A9N8VWL6_9GLOM|nr:9775_t:CDS:2 [Diversispora eburnea]